MTTERTETESAEPSGITQVLIGAPIPPLDLDSTGGRVNLAAISASRLVLFIYPHATGLPDVPVRGWEQIPGALGCTAESCAFRDRHDRVSQLGASIAGLSVQTVVEQREFAARVGLAYPLISDPSRSLAETLDLPTFTVDDRTFYRRITIVARRSRIEKIFYPIPDPAEHPAVVVSWLARS